MPVHVPLYPDGPAPGSLPGQEQPTIVPVPASRRTPAILVLPGGGYGCRAAHEADPIAIWVNSLGLSSAVLHYRHAPHRHPVPLHDAQRGVRMLRARAEAWNIDPGRIAILGFSAGGHLAACAANFGADGIAASGDPVERESARVQACIACYAVISTGPHGHQGSFTNLLGERRDAAQERHLSLENSVTRRNPPTFIWHTADDDVVPVQNALLYAQALIAQQVPTALHIYPHGHHGLELAFTFPGSASTWTAVCAAWLREIGFL